MIDELLIVQYWRCCRRLAVSWYRAIDTYDGKRALRSVGGGNIMKMLCLMCKVWIVTAHADAEDMMSSHRHLWWHARAMWMQPWNIIEMLYYVQDLKLWQHILTQIMWCHHIIWKLKLSHFFFDNKFENNGKGTERNKINTVMLHCIMMGSIGFSLQSSSMRSAVQYISCRSRMIDRLRWLE